MASLRRDEFAPGKSDRHEMCQGTQNLSVVPF